MRNRGLLILLVGAALSTTTMSSCSSDKGNGYEHYKRTHAVQTEEEYNDSMAYVQQQQGQQYNIQQQPQAEPYEYQRQQSPQVIVVPSYSNGYGYNDAGYNNQGYDRYGHYSDRWDSDHHRDPYHAPSSSSVGTHVAAGAVGAAAGAAAGYAYARNKATSTPTTAPRYAPTSTRVRTAPVSNIVARPIAAPAYKPSAPATSSLRNTAFGNSLTKKYNTSSSSSPSVRTASPFKRSTSSGGSIFGKSKRR